MPPARAALTEAPGLLTPGRGTEQTQPPAALLCPICSFSCLSSPDFGLNGFFQTSVFSLLLACFTSFPTDVPSPLQELARDAGCGEGPSPAAPGRSGTGHHPPHEHAATSTLKRQLASVSLNMGSRGTMQSDTAGLFIFITF